MDDHAAKKILSKQHRKQERTTKGSATEKKNAHKKVYQCNNSNQKNLVSGNSGSFGYPSSGNITVDDM